MSSVAFVTEHPHRFATFEASPEILAAICQVAGKPPKEPEEEGEVVNSKNCTFTRVFNDPADAERSAVLQLAWGMAAPGTAALNWDGESFARPA